MPRSTIPVSSGSGTGNWLGPANEMITYVQNGTNKYREDRIGAIRSSDLKNWEDISERIRFPEGTNHGTVFTAPVKVVERIKTMYPAENGRTG